MSAVLIIPRQRYKKYLIHKPCRAKIFCKSNVNYYLCTELFEKINIIVELLRGISMVNKMPITSWEEIQKRRRKNQQEEKKNLEKKGE
jgi:hypothetical protein